MKTSPRNWACRLAFAVSMDLEWGCGSHALGWKKPAQRYLPAPALFGGLRFLPAAAICMPGQCYRPLLVIVRWRTVLSLVIAAKVQLVGRSHRLSARSPNSVPALPHGEGCMLSMDLDQKRISTSSGSRKIGALRASMHEEHCVPTERSHQTILENTRLRTGSKRRPAIR